MSYTVALLNSKGGVGKTTATIYLATSLARSGRAVEVWDADPQGSATEWIDQAEESGQVPPFTLVPVNGPSLKRQRTGADVVLIDTPPGNPSIQNAVLARADLVIVPTTASWPDMTRVWATLDALGDTPAVVLLNMVNPRTVAYREAREALTETASFETAIPAREKIKGQAGTIPADLSRWTAAAHELTTMMEN
ncbi:ParA family protein [Kocuria palustris]|uniref:ParA family protein n=1 Tax=Kocuria palustris TaxID=71999 RepID=UPI0011A39B6C|nr:ParA family protein [Kocuria palustris]